MSPSYSNFVKTTNHFRKHNNILLIGGGPHFTVRNTNLSEFRYSDVVTFGEGEETLLSIISCDKETQEWKLVPGIGYLEKDSSLILNKRGNRIRDLDVLPFPALEEFPLNSYHLGLNRPLERPLIPMITTRGCPFKCHYCASSNVFDGKAISRSIESINSEITYWKNKLGIKSIIFWDDTFTANREKSIHLCEELKKANISWVCTTRADVVDYELLKLMQKCGCKVIHFGAESFDSATLEFIGKQIPPALLLQQVRYCNEIGIKPSVSIIIGFPWQSRQDIEKDIRALFECNPAYSIINIFSPYAGTKIYDQFNSEFHGSIEFVQENQKKFDMTLTSSIKELTSIRNNAMVKFYINKIFSGLT